MARVNPIAHGQALTAQLLAANSQPSMAPVRTVAVPQMRSQGINLAEELMNERQFNRDFYAQKDGHKAASALEAQRAANEMERVDKQYGQQIELEKTRNTNALTRLDKSNTYNIALEGLRNSNNQALQKIEKEARREEQSMMRRFQMGREALQKKWEEKENDRNYQRNKDEWERRWKEEQADLDRREKRETTECERRLEARIAAEESSDAKRLKARIDAAKEQRDIEIEDTDDLAEVQRKSYEERQKWVTGDNQRYYDNVYRQYVLSQPKVPVYDQDGDVIENPTDDQYMTLAELPDKIKEDAQREAYRRTQDQTSLIEGRYNEILKNPLPGGFTRGNPLTPPSQPIPNYGGTTLPSPSQIGGMGVFLPPKQQTPQAQPNFSPGTMKYFNKQP